MGWIATLFSWTGRYTRFQFIAAMFAPYVMALPVVLAGQYLELGPLQGKALLTAAGLFLVVGGYIQFGAYVKRLHDLGYSGWWLAGFLILMGGSLYLIEELHLKESIWGLVIIAPVMAIFLIGSLAMIYAPGTPGKNPYGPDPFGRGLREFQGRTEGVR